MSHQVFTNAAIRKMIEGASNVDTVLVDLPAGSAACRPSAIRMDKAAALAAMSGKRSASAWMRGAAWIVASCAYGAETPAALLKGLDKPSVYALCRALDAIAIGKGIDGCMLRIAVNVAWDTLADLPARTRNGAGAADTGAADTGAADTGAADTGAGAGAGAMLTKAETALAAEIILAAWATAFTASYVAQIAEAEAAPKKARTKKARTKKTHTNIAA